MKITKEYLLAIGFEECPTEIALPDWYTHFFGTDNGITSGAFEYQKDDYVFTIYFSPIGLIGQYCEDDVSRPYLEYFKLVNQTDLIDCFEDYFDMKIALPS